MSTQTQDELIKALKNVNIVTYALFVPPLAFYFAILAKMLYSKGRRHLISLIIVCVLMIIA